MQQAFVAVLTGLLALPCAAAVVRAADGKNLRTQKSSCPGTALPCNGKGECVENTGVCWCKMGFGGTDCSSEIAETYDIESVNSPSMEDMVGRYVRVPMYMQETAGDPRNVKFIHYDPISQGWAISKLNSSCTDDICFFAYAKGQPVPPPKGYVYGQPNKHVYYKQLIFDDKELYPTKEPGYHMTVSYSPDPNALGVSDVLGDPESTYSAFTGRYILQPRYVHQRSGKYAIMPVTLNAPGKLWVVVGLEGVGPERRWEIKAQTADKSLNRYTIPKDGWSPKAASFKLLPSCQDHVSMEVCNSLEDHCRGDAADVKWVQSCCRDTCNTCDTPSNSCSLPKTAMGAAMLLQRFNRTK